METEKWNDCPPMKLIGTVDSTALQFVQSMKHLRHQAWWSTWSVGTWPPQFGLLRIVPCCFPLPCCYGLAVLFFVTFFALRTSSLLFYSFTFSLQSPPSNLQILASHTSHTTPQPKSTHKQQHPPPIKHKNTPLQPTNMTTQNTYNQTQSTHNMYIHLL